MGNQKTNIDDVLEKFSIFGKYHLQFMFFAILSYIVNSMLSYNFIFVVEEVQYRCLDEAFSNNTCRVINGKGCSEWVYDNPHSFAAEFQLACQDWKITLIGSVNSFGYMMGLLVVGPLSDRIGRKNTLILAGLVGATIGVSKTFSSSYWVYVCLEFLGSALGDNYSPLYVLNVEIVSVRKRVIFYFLCALGSVAGGMLYSLLSWGFPYWRTMLQVVYALGFGHVIYFFTIDESPRWLLTKGKNNKAIAIVEKMHHKNKITIDRNAVDKLFVETEYEMKGLINLLKITFLSRTLLKRFLVCIVWWTTSTFVNYGMMINSVSLQGNKYLNFALIHLIDLPGNFIFMYILHNFKRKKPLIVTFFATALLCFVQPFLPGDLPWLSVMVYVVGMMMTSFYFSITYIFTSELFPTYTRNSMHALCSALGRFGSIAAPQTPLLRVYWPSLPTLVFGLASLVAGLATLLVPDTADRALPDTVREAEHAGRTPGGNNIGIHNLGMTAD